MRNISLILSYDGTDFHGWQSQPFLRNVEDTFKETAEKILNHSIKLYAAARTDAGVHARGQVVNFFTERSIPISNLVRALNSLLPPDVRVIDGREVEENFHARYSAKSKTYRYFIMNSPVTLPFISRYTLHIPYPLSVDLMEKALKKIVGRHDFSAFKKKNTFYKNPVRNVISARLHKKGTIVCLEVKAQGFLRYMVRNIVGTLLLVGKEKLSEEDFITILESKDRNTAGPTAPPHGLFLWHIDY